MFSYSTRATFSAKIVTKFGSTKLKS